MSTILDLLKSYVIFKYSAKDEILRLVFETMGVGRRGVLSDKNECFIFQISLEFFNVPNQVMNP